MSFFQWLMQTMFPQLRDETEPEPGWADGMPIQYEEQE